MNQFDFDWQHFWEKFIIFCFAVGIILLTLFLSSCTTAEKVNIPPIAISTWAGDSSREAITRFQENKSIQCHEPEFDQYICLTETDLYLIYQTLLQCKQW